MSGAWVKLPPLRRERLPNGLTLIVAERPALPLVTLRLAFRAGSSHDPVHRAGLAAFTARMLRHGAGERDERRFAEDLDAIGGLFGASIGLDQLTVDAELTTETWDAGRALFLDALLRPTLPEAPLARERERALAEIAQSHDEPEHVASRAFQRFLYEGHPYGHPPEGTATSIAGVTRADVAGFHAEGMVPDGAVLVVVGDVDAAREMARWRDDLAGWGPAGHVPAPPDDAPDAPGGRVILVHDEGAGQAQWRTGNVGFRRVTPLYPHLVLANTILGGGFTSRLVQEVRVERGLTYGIGSRFMLGFSRGSFEIASFTKNATLTQMHEIVGRQVAAYRREGATADELAAARAYVLGLHVRRFETPDGLASALAEAEMHGLGEEMITGFRRAIESVTLADLNAAMPDLFPEAMLTVVVGDAGALAGPCAEIGEVTVVQSEFAEGMEP
jgi:zinc protease